MGVRGTAIVGATTMRAKIARSNVRPSDATIHLYHAMAISHTTINICLRTAHDIPLIPIRMLAEDESPPGTCSSTRRHADSDHHSGENSSHCGTEPFSEQLHIPFANLGFNDKQQRTKTGTHADAALSHFSSDICGKLTACSCQDHPYLTHN